MADRDGGHHGFTIAKIKMCFSPIAISYVVEMYARTNGGDTRHKVTKRYKN